MPFRTLTSAIVITVTSCVLLGISATFIGKSIPGFAPILQPLLFLGALVVSLPCVLAVLAISLTALLIRKPTAAAGLAVAANWIAISLLVFNVFHLLVKMFGPDI